jgi:predicted aspartyl protease
MPRAVPVSPRAWPAILLAGLLQACAAPCNIGQGDVLPVTFHEQLQPLVPVEINGQTVPLLLDTGASVTALLPEGVQQLGLQQDGLRKTRLYGVGGTSREQNALLARLRIGRLDLRQLTVPVVLHSAPGQQPMAGLLGADVLSTQELEIDIPGRRVVLHNTAACATGTPPWAGDAASLPVELLPGRQVVVRVQVNGFTVRALFDTGAMFTVLRPSVARRAGMPEEAFTAPAAGVLLGAGPGTSAVRAFRVETIGIGEETFRDNRVGVAELGQQATYGMVLGQDFIGRRRFWLSYARQRLYVWKRPVP